VIPGPVRPWTADFVAAQHEELAALAWLIRDGHATACNRRRWGTRCHHAEAWGDAGRHEATLAGRLVATTSSDALI